MPKRSSNPSDSDKLELEDFLDDPEDSADSSRNPHLFWLYGAGGLVVLVILVFAGINLAYSGKIYPGVSVDGVYVGGLTSSQAAAKVNAKITGYVASTLPIESGTNRESIPLKALNLSYNTASSVQVAANFGRQGSLVNQLHARLRAFLNRPTAFSSYTYASASLSPYILRLDSAVNTPVTDAALMFNGARAMASSSSPGNRLDMGMLTALIDNSLATTSSGAVNAPVYQLGPEINTASVQASLGQVTNYIASPLTLSVGGKTQQISQNTIISWIQVEGDTTPSFLQSLNLNDIYPASTDASLSLNQKAITAYVASFAQSVDKPAVNATLSWQNNQPTVVAPSQTGQGINQTQAVNDIVAALTSPGASRNIALNLQTTQAAVNASNIASLGITQLISQGETYFPGSPAGRLQNVRTGAARYNDMLIAPGEEFDFGAQLGTVDAATGYVPELVIQNGYEDLQYGGGLCQVCTTAFRAALLAGLPIDERENHSFAISYYQWPYNAPGVDATIYYPEVDLKFTNNTGHWILIQTDMNGYYLTFNFYGTKVEQGVIRGPYFISGSNNATEASHTVFYQDVENESGQVTSTNAFNSYYEPSTNYPVEDTVN